MVGENMLVDYHIGAVKLQEEVKAKFKYLCTIEKKNAKTKIAELITQAVKKIKV
jgi:hypothetical protein